MSASVNRSLLATSRWNYRQPPETEISTNENAALSITVQIVIEHSSAKAYIKSALKTLAKETCFDRFHPPHESQKRTESPINYFQKTSQMVNLRVACSKFSRSVFSGVTERQHLWSIWPCVAALSALHKKG